MLVAPWERGGEWNDSGISGISRWLNRVWHLVLAEYSQGNEINPADRQNAERELFRITHQTIRKVTGDLEKLRFNTMIAALMEFTNYLIKVKETAQVTLAHWEEALENLLLLLAPTAPHLAEELWQQTGRNYSIHNQDWPHWDEELTREEEITLVIQVNGKLRDTEMVEAEATQETVETAALASEKVKSHTDGKQIIKKIYIKGRLLNIVVKY